MGRRRVHVEMFRQESGGILLPRRDAIPYLRHALREYEALDVSTRTLYRRLDDLPWVSLPESGGLFIVIDSAVAGCVQRADKTLQDRQERQADLTRAAAANWDAAKHARDATGRFVITPKREEKDHGRRGI